MIKTGGENVHASEVEAAICSHPAVAAAAAVSLPHARLGETVGAVVVLRNGFRWSGPAARVAAVAAGEPASSAVSRPPGLTTDKMDEEVTLTQLQAHCRGRGLAGFKLPRAAAATECRAPLPANAMGKVLKEAVRNVRHPPITPVAAAR